MSDSDSDLETSLAGSIYRNTIAITDPREARHLAQQILREFDVQVSLRSGSDT